jgi:hypothetical protein
VVSGARAPGVFADMCLIASVMETNSFAAQRTRTVGRLPS